MDGRLVHGSSVEGQAADYSTRLEHWAGIGTQADAGVMSCRTHAVVVEG